MEKGLVSMVTPCYNTGKYVHRLLDSILMQTYPQIEMYVINDGSIDDTSDIVNSYIPKYEKRGYRLTLIEQENSGQSVAVMKGMKLIQGQYFVWPDSDDYYASTDAVELMVRAFKECGEEYGLVRTQENLLEDGTFKIIGRNGEAANNNYDKIQLFEDCLYCRNGYYFAPGAYMADFQRLKDSTTLDIYTDKNAGQNWQLMLPLLYNYKCYTIQIPLYNVVVRLASHSRGQYNGFDKTMKKIHSYERTILETLRKIKGLPKEKCDYYSLEIKKKYCKERIHLSFSYHKKYEFRKYYSEAVSFGMVGTKEKLYSIFFDFPIVIKAILHIYRCIVR